MMVRVSEGMLRTYSERFDRPNVQLVDMRVIVSLHEGANLVPFARVEGRRELGGTVAFQVTDEDNHAAELSRRLVGALAALCRCARTPEECDCCSLCAGAGARTAGEVMQPCWDCAGMGYLPRSL